MKWCPKRSHAHMYIQLEYAHHVAISYVIIINVLATQLKHIASYMTLSNFGCMQNMEMQVRNYSYPCNTAMASFNGHIYNTITISMQLQSEHLFKPNIKKLWLFYLANFSIIPSIAQPQYSKNSVYYLSLVDSGACHLQIELACKPQLSTASRLYG